MIAEVGAGIAVSPNATRILHGLGLRGSLERTGVRPTAWLQRRWEDGRILSRTPLGNEVEHRFGSPQYQMHRADLAQALADAFPADRLHRGRRFVSLRQDDTAVEALFEDGDRIRADVLVGADGIHSRVRAALFGPEKPVFTGCVAYRGLVDVDRLRHLDLEPAIQIWPGPYRHFAHYPVRSGVLMNIVGIIEQDTWRTESWTEPGDMADLRAAFQGWHPQVGDILAAMDETFRWALFERPPMPRWSEGRVTLLGDACHAMLPFMAQGAAQAIEDGAVLASVLASVESSDDVLAALRAYHVRRLPRTSRVQQLAAANRTRLNLPDGEAQRARDMQLASGASDLFFAEADWLYRYDATKSGP
jgi:salicylate hydroxylase